MINEIRNLKKRFYKKFVFSTIVLLLTLCVLIVLVIYTAIDYANNHKNFLVMLLFSIFLVFSICITIVYERPFICDLIYLKKNLPKKIVGIVVGLESKEEGGDPPTTKYYPIVKDENTGKLIKLDIMGTDVRTEIHKQCRYTFLYLPHTRLAILIKNFQYIDKLR